MPNPIHWIWQSPTWPALRHDAAQLEAPLRQAHIALARLQGKAQAVGAAEFARLEQEVWSREAVATAAIEGEKLELGSVRSSVGRRLCIASDFVARVPRHVDGLLDVMEDAAGGYAAPLTGKLLCRWQGALFPEGRSGLRTIETGRYRSHAHTMQIVSGPHGRERMHYEAPPSSAIPREMRAFLAWYNDHQESQGDGIVRAGLAHLWFEAIHPFEDGNGRVGRAIIDRALAQAMGNPTRLHGMAAGMHRRQEAYYDALNRAQRGNGEATDWLLWFCNTLGESCEAVSALLDGSLARARFWSEHRELACNERQRKVLNRMLEAGPGGFEGGLTQRKYVALTGATTATASRDLAWLAEKGLIVRGQGAGRSTHYLLNIPGWG